MRRNKLSIKIVGAWRNFCSQAHRNATARYFLPFELSGNITIMYLENNLASKIQQSQHYTSERAVEGASPYTKILPPQNRSARCFLYFVLVICSVWLRHSSLLTETLYSSSFSTDINASCGTDTEPSCLIRFLPSFCFSNSFFFLVISPP